MIAPRWIATGVVLLGVACAGDLPARTPPSRHETRAELEAAVATFEQGVEAR